MNKNPKILIATGIYPPDIGGPATYSRILAESLPAFGFNISILSFGEVRKMPKVIRHLVYFIKAISRGRRCDIIFAQDPVSVGLPACLAAFFLRKKFILKVVGDYAWEQYIQKSKVKNNNFITPEDFQNQKFDLITELRRAIEHGVANWAQKIIVPSLYLKKIIKMWGIEEDKIKVVYNAFEVPQTAITKKEARERMGLSGTVLVSAGRLVPWKGFDVLIDIMPEVLREIPDMKLYIIGEGPDRGSLELKIKNNRLDDKIVLTGRLSHDYLLQYLAAADMFILNTGYEGLSHQILEAMALGVPIITTNVGGNPEVIENGKSGMLVEYNNKREIKNAVLNLYNNDQMRNMFIVNAKSAALRFDKNKMIKEVIEILS